MAVTIDITANTSQATQAATQLSANLSSAFSGIQAQLKAMESSTTSTTSKMVTGLQSLSQQAVKQVAVQGDLSKSFLQTGQAAQTQLTQFEKLRLQYLKTEQTSKSLGGSLGGLLSSFKGLAAIAGISFSIQGLVSLTESIVEAGIANDRLMLSLKGALGSAQAAGEAYQFVEQVANRLGIGLQTAVEGFAKLSAATQGTIVQGEATRDLFVSLAEASRVMGLTTAETGGVVTALTQIIGKNTVSMEELRQQLGERLPQVLRLTAKEMGVTTSRFIEMVSKGEVLAQDFIPAVTRAFQQMGKEAPAAAQSVQAALERVGNAWLTLKVTIAQSGLLELVARIAEEMAGVINRTTAWLNRTRRMAGEMGLAPMREELARLDEQILRLQEHTTEAGEFGFLSARQLEGFKVQRQALVDQIALKQQVFEKDEAVRKSADALAKVDIENAAAQDKRVEALRKASTAYTGLEDDIKGVVLQLEALRSFDVPSLQAMQIDPFGPDFEARFHERETALLKQQKDLLDKRAGLSKSDAARAVQEAGQSAVEIAKAREEALATSLKREEVMIQQSADERRRIIDEEASAALQAQGPSAVAAIEAKRSQARRQIAVDEAKALEAIRLKALDDQQKAQEIRLNAEIAGAGKNLSAATKAQEDLKNLQADTELERVKIRAKTEDALQNVSKKSVDEQIKQAQELNKIIKETEQDRLKSRIDLVDEQISLVQAQVDAEILTTQQGFNQIQVLQQQRFADTRLLYEQEAQTAIDAVNAEVAKTIEGTQARVDAEALAAEQIAKIRQGLAHQIQTVNISQQTETIQFLKKQQDEYERFAKSISDPLTDIFDDLLNGTLNLVQTFKKAFLRTIAEIAAQVATMKIIVPIITSVLGGIPGTGGSGGIVESILKVIGLGGSLGLGSGGSTGGGLLETGGTALTALGLGKQLYSMLGLDTLTNYVGTGLSTLRDALMGGLRSLFQSSATQASQQALMESALVEQGAGITPAGQAGAFAGQMAGVASGLAALGGGIYAALNASNNAAKAFYAASAAAGAFAASVAGYAAITGTAALATAAGTGWTGIGLVAAAVMAVVGVVLDRVIKPAGPTLAVGGPRGLNVGTSDGKLQVQGDLGSTIFRTDKVDPGVARGVQAQMEAGITSAVVKVVETINAVALDPSKLVGPTQEALQTALRNVQAINSSNAKKMEKDITEQLRFLNVKIVGGLLEPVNLAFDQLRDMGTVQEQIDRLPVTVMGLVEIFKTMNQQLDEIGKSENTDVLRQLSAVRNQVENFGNRIAGTAGQIAENIVTSIVESFQATVDTNLAGQITQFSGLLNSSLRALAVLRNTRQTLEQAGLGGEAVGGQIDRLAQATSEMSARISTEIVSGALSDLSEDLNQFLIQPIQVQATTVNALFTDSLAAIKALWDAWHALEAAGLDASGVQAQFTKLLTGLIETTFTVIKESFGAGEFSEFLKILVQLPPALVALNPVLQQVQELGKAFASVVGPIGQTIETLQNELRTTEERIAFTSSTISGLRQAISDAGTSVEKTLPLYAKLAEQLQANAQAQIDAANEAAQKQIEAVNKAADAQIKAINDTADAWIKAVNDAADAQIKVVNQLADAEITAVNAVIDAAVAQVNYSARLQTDAVNAWADAWTKAINDAADAQRAIINAWVEAASQTASQLKQVNDILISARSPDEQRQALFQQEVALAAVVAGGGPGAGAATSELIDVLNQQLALARQSKDLKVEEETLKKLEVLQEYLRDRLVKMTGESDPVLAQIAISEKSRGYLEYISDVQRKSLEYVTTTQQQWLKSIADDQAIAVGLLEQYRTNTVDAINLQRDVSVLAIQGMQERLVGAFELARTTQIAAIEDQRDQTIKAIEDQRDALVKSIKEDLVYQLSLIQYELQKLFAIQYKAITGQDLPAPVAPTRPTYTAPPAAPHQRGGVMGLASGQYYAQGGMVRAMLEPGERVYGPMSHAQEGALLALNAAIPRFAQGGLTVPGSGSGDTFPAMLASGNIVLNKRAAGVLDRLGMQSGGTVQGGTNTVVHNYHYHFPNLTIRSQSDLEDLKRALAELKRRGMTRE